MAKNYCVIIGDIVQSKEIKNRKGFQRKFSDILKRINREFSSQVVSRFGITMGDEFQGVLKGLSQSYSIIDTIQKMFYPVKLRFGVGWGKITTQIKKEAIGMDGPAFHKAREAVERAKKENKEVIYQTFSKEKDIALNALILAISGFKESWTQRQFQAVKLYGVYKTQAKAAKAMKVDRTTLSKMLKAAKADQVSELEKAVIELCGLF